MMYSTMLSNLSTLWSWEAPKYICEHTLKRGIVNSLVGTAKWLYNGEPMSTDIATGIASTAGINAGYEFARATLEQATIAAIPGGQNLAKLINSTSSIVTNGTRAAIENDDIARVVTKNLAYALNSAAFGPVIAFPLGYATDFVIDKAADNLTWAYNAYGQKNSQLNISEKDKTAYTHTEDSDGFVNISPKSSSSTKS